MKSFLKTCILSACFIFTLPAVSTSQDHSIAQEWNEVLLESIRNDLARPTVHARNLWHTSAAMYDIWSVFHPECEPYLLGKVIQGISTPFDGFTVGPNPDAQIEEAISFAIYRILSQRFRFSPEGFNAQLRFNNYMTELGYDINNTSQDYSTGSAAALGNYIGQKYLDFGLQDGANELLFYTNAYYQPVNDPLVMQQSGNPTITDPDRWQPLTLDVFIDQSGNEIPFNTPPFLSPEWGNVIPFSMTADDMTTYQRDGDTYRVYHDPGPPPKINDKNDNGLYGYIGGFSMVAQWSSHLDPADDTMIDISPASFGNLTDLPEDFIDYDRVYNYMEGGDKGIGRPLNPVTGQPYAPNMVKRADYARCLAEFWADGPDSETPPGHWFTLINYVNDHPSLVKKFSGQGEELSDLEWDIKSYFLLGSTMHDCAVSTWGIKGYYDYVRPVSAIRYMAGKGQSSDPNGPYYDPHGMLVIPGFIEPIMPGDPLAGVNGEYVGTMKLYGWRGPEFINDPMTDIAGVGWIRGEEWWPYQRPSFVTPNFAGYLSGHSTFSRGAAQIITKLTGSEFFPGGMGTFDIEANEFLVFEDGPSESFQLQWATYNDASDQTSLSRIWGGIHPPADDIKGRLIGQRISEDVFELALDLFYDDNDQDGFYNYIDCDDNNALAFPGGVESCDDIDNDCNGMIDDGLPLNTYYADADSDGFGTSDNIVEICSDNPPIGFVVNALDCDDASSSVYQDAPELCDGIDNDCNGDIDDNIPYYDYFLDTDNDGYGDPESMINTCESVAPSGYVTNPDDCDDTLNFVNADAPEICDNIDNDCNGEIDDNIPYYDFYMDMDQDGFGDINVINTICVDVLPAGFVRNADDCDDNNANIYLGAPEVADNGVDEDCSGFDLFLEANIFPNPVKDSFTIRYPIDGIVRGAIFSVDQKYAREFECTFNQNQSNEISMQGMPEGMYVVNLFGTNDELLYQTPVIKAD